MSSDTNSSLQCVLRSTAWKILGGILRVAKRMPFKRNRVSVTVHQSGIAVTMTVHPVDSQADEPLPGRWLSDAELLVWQALRPGEWLVGKEIAARVNRKYDDPRFKALLMNLADRGVLCHDDDTDKGFSRAIPVSSGATSTGMEAG